MDYYKSKYTTMPDNAYFDRRMSNGDKLTDIFDSRDYQSKCFSLDEKRPITVRVGDKYNYVTDNFILFDNWFAYCRDFLENDNCTYAYRRRDEKGLPEGGVLIKRDGSFVTREEFLHIMYNEGFFEGDDTALVKQQNGLFNFINVNSGKKAEQIGLDVNYIDYFGSTMDLYRIAIGDKLNRDEENEMWGTYSGMEIAREKHIKINLYSLKRGIISPSLWFDFIDKFSFYPDPYNSRRMRLSNQTIVYLNKKMNLIDQNGNLLSDVWFDVCHLYNDGSGKAGILKSDSVKNLPTEVGDYFNYNPEKFNLYTIDYYGKIRAV